jgi:survival of motor neuron protein-interacting protein 1
MSRRDYNGMSRDNGSNYEGMLKKPRLETNNEPRRVYEDQVFGQYPALPVGIDNDEDEDSKDVMQYLRSVRREAERENVVYFSDKRKLEDNQVGLLDDRSNQTENPQGHVEASKLLEVGQEDEAKFNLWQDNLLSKFLDLKQTLAQYNWQSMAVQNVHLPETAVQWRKYILEHKPYPIQYFYTRIDRPTIFKLIVYFTKWLSVSTSSNLSKWIWTIFLRMDNLLDPNECSVLRDLGKKAVKLSTRLTSDNSSEVSQYAIDMIIVIVGNYYGQRDLLGSRCNSTGGDVISI